MKWCPVCRKGWPDAWSVCGDCIAGLVEDPDATVACPHCHRDWPARMQSCPDCLGELRPDPDAAARAYAAVLAVGGHLPRPADRPPFALGPACALLRTAPRSSLLYIGPDELLEATVDSRGHAAVAPMRCHDLDGAPLFDLTRYEAADAALVAVDSAGAPLATFLRRGGDLDVRDETSAPVARMRRVRGGYALDETGGEELASVLVSDIGLGEDPHRVVDDQWSLDPRGELPLRPLGAVALLLAGKALLGRARPAPAPVTPKTVT